MPWSENVHQYCKGNKRCSWELYVKEAKFTVTLYTPQGQNQPRLLDFMTPDGKIKSIPKKKQKRLLIRPAEVVDIMEDNSDDEGASNKPKKKARLCDEQFMTWVRPVLVNSWAVYLWLLSIMTMIM